MDTDQILAVTVVALTCFSGLCCVGYLLVGSCREKKQDVLLEEV